MGEQDDGLKQNITARYYCVALLDILNQRQALSRWQDLPSDGTLNEEFKSLMVLSLSQVWAVRKHARGLIDTFTKAAISEKDLADVPDKTRTLLREWTKSELEVQSFSDTTVWFAPMKKVAGEFATKDIYGMLAGIAGVYLWSLANGIALRGAIEVGAGVDLFKGEIYGPCLSVVHHLESQEAGCPRVLIGPGLLRFLDQIVSNGPDKSPLSYEQATKIREQLIAIDEVDGRPVLDYLGKFTHDMIGRDHAQLADKACKFVLGEASRFREKGDTKLAPRYHQVLTYFKSRQELWQFEL